MGDYVLQIWRVGGLLAVELSIPVVVELFEEPVLHLNGIFFGFLDL